MTLEDGEYEYKFIVDDEWKVDPLNANNKNGNSVFTIGEVLEGGNGSEGGNGNEGEGGNENEGGNASTPSAPTYKRKYQYASVVGDFSKLTNCTIKNVWSVDDVSGDMQYIGNGIYKIVITFDKTTEPVEVSYKIAFNHGWEHSIGTKSVETAAGFQEGGYENNMTFTIPAGATSVTIVASEADIAAYDSISNPAKVNELITIANTGDGINGLVYTLILLAGCAMVLVAAKKRFVK